MTAPRWLPMLAVTALLACGDKGEDSAATDGADGTSAADGSDGSDGSDGTDPLAALSIGCLDAGCDGPAVRAAARAACIDAVAAAGGDGTDALMYFGERRGPSEPPVTAMNCTTPSMSDAACEALCARAGMADREFVPGEGRCSCSQDQPTTPAALATELAGLSCDPATADVWLNLIAEPGYTFALVQATCADSTPTGDCEDFRVAANDGLNLDISETTDGWDGGCAMSR